MKIINNTTEKLADDLRVTIKKRSRVSMAAACFSVYAFEELKAQLENLDELRFIFTSPAFLDEKPKKAQREFYIPRLNRERTLHGSEFEIKLRSEFRQRAISQECAHWIREKARFKSNKTMEGMTGFLTVDSDSPVAYAPVNGFTREDLGCDRGGRMFSMINRVDAPESKAYLELFDQLWNDQSHLKDVTDKVLESITTAYQENSPEFLYFYALYNIFGSFLEQVNEDDLPSETNGFKESQVWNKLYTFQKDAVIAIISKLEQYNGCILADSVGLGKTFTALAVIKYYENRNLRVLVLCPKKLSDNWMTYKANYVNNPIAGDRLRYDVLYHTDLSRDKGFSGEIDLSKLNWSAYDLVVIDESHNFRNGGDVDNEGKENRYTRLMNKVIRPGARTRVLMLSATPVNNRFYDLRNQLALAYEGDSSEWQGKLDISRSVEEVFRNAQKVFNEWSKLDVASRTTDQLMQMLDFEFFQILDAVTIARSRRHIEKYYDVSEIGKFPTRLPPISKRPPLTDLPGAISYSEIYDDLLSLLDTITEKIEHPINPGNKKVIIFTAFSDTAQYLYDHVSAFAGEKYGLNTALVTGSVEGRTTIPKFKADLNNVLTCFSPRSKDKAALMPDGPDIDLLIATDCISEGQNLQDCDCLINYDIHWNPVRLVQRFGRIDRIGSKNDVIQLINFWPDMDLDSYINLKGRVETRMKALVMTSTGDDNLLSPEEQGNLEYRREQLKRLQTEVVDLEEMGTGVSITDLGLNEFRMEVMEYAKRHPELETTPGGISAVTQALPDAPAGVVFVLKNVHNEININDRNRLHPYYLVYLTEEGEIVYDHLSPRSTLETMRQLCHGKTEPIQALCRAFNEETRCGEEMQLYSDLLEEAVLSIVDAKEDSDLDSLFRAGGTTALLNQISGLDDFELICFLVVKEG